MKYILASASPRRKQLLKEILPDFEIIPAKGEEIFPAELSPLQTVKMLARHKAEEVFLAQGEKGITVIGADTVVVYKDKILGKPSSPSEAEEMLKTLSGKEHTVLTGVCILLETEKGEIKKLVKVGESTVDFRKMTEEEIKSYVKTGSPMDKAGAYGIQDGDFATVKEGSYSCVVGLPKELLKEMLSSLGAFEEKSGREFLKEGR